jgi:hypothetical protein
LTGEKEDFYVLVLKKEKRAVITTVEEETGFCVSLLSVCKVPGLNTT